MFYILFCTYDMHYDKYFFKGEWKLQKPQGQNI